MARSTGGVRRSPIGALAVVVLAGAVLGLPGRAAAEDDGRLGQAPWFPMIDAEKSAQELVEQNALGIIRVGDQGWRANRGKYRSSLTRVDFYKTIGRVDLARQQSSSNTTSAVLTWTGVVGIGAGALLFYAHVAQGGLEPGPLPGLVFVGGGLASFGVSSFFTGPSVSADEAEEMSRRYNEVLKRHVEDETERKQAPIQALRPRILPWTDGRTGGGLTALAVF